MHKKPPSVSVALVTRNRPTSLRRALESWRTQTVAPVEIVVSDDSDNDQAASSASVAREFGCVYTRGPRRGLYANRNHASLSCRGTHILAADDDHTHPADYTKRILDLVHFDPQRVWIFTLRDPAHPDAPLTCPPELHPSGLGHAPADPSACAAISDGAALYPREIFDQGLRYDETYRFGGLWYLWGKTLVKRGWRISFSDRTFVWHHATADLSDRWASTRAVQDQLVTTTYVQFVNAFWFDRSLARVLLSGAYLCRRLALPDSAMGFQVRARIPPLRAMHAVFEAWRARRVYGGGKHPWISGAPLREI